MMLGLGIPLSIATLVLGVVGFQMIFGTPRNQAGLLVIFVAVVGYLVGALALARKVRGH